MRTLSSIETFDLFWEKQKQVYTHLTRQQAKEACYYVWEEMNKTLQEPGLPPVRLKYFGQFTVKEGRVRHLLSQLDAKFDKRKILDRVYTEQLVAYRTYLEMKYEGLFEQFKFEVEDFYLKEFESFIFYLKGDCRIIVNTLDNTFGVLSGTDIPFIPANQYWFKSYDLLREILKKV